MRDHVGEMAHAIGPDAMILEFGSGSGVKTAKLLGALSNPAGYVAVEISRSALDASIQRLQAKLPHVPMHGVCADYTAPFSLPSIVHTSEARRVAYFPGSTLGNFEPDRAVKFLRLMRDQVGDQGGVLIGIDLKKDPSILHAAYNDHRGITAEFNRNVARRLRDELGADIHLEALRHYAFYHPVQGRIEMHLVTNEPQSFKLGDHPIELARGETIHTEFSYKYTVEEFSELAARAGFERVTTWVDPDQLFSVHYLKSV